MSYNSTMKKIAGFLFVLFFIQNAFASPLVYKASKNVGWGDFVEIANFDATKYRQIRIAVVTDNTSYSSFVLISAIEDSSNIILDEAGDRVINYSKVFDSPPSKIQIKVKGKGNYKVFVWGI